MPINDSGEFRLSCVVRNDFGQYSVWPVRWKVPEGWTREDYHGSREECLDYIGQIWKDQRPLHLR